MTGRLSAAPAAVPVLALAAALGASLGACGGGGDGDTPVDAAPVVDVPGDAMPRQVVTENVPLVVNEIVEAILVGGPGDYARLQMSASGAPLDWNMHGHANGSTQVVKEELKVPSVDYLFQPTAQADWYLLIRNKGQTDITVQLKIELFGEMTWSGWQ
ncbi:MAG TPA: hypothetical protein VNO30_14905 [Kofleriaceae bacterium]|nr:hypothetical protein [Kofleriaceae bacterium]